MKELAESIKAEVVAELTEIIKREAVDLISARLSAFEQAQKRAEEEEPPRLMSNDEFSHAMLAYALAEPGDEARHCHSVCMKQFSYLRRELARLREGLRRQEGEMPDRTLSDYMDNPERVPVFGAVTYRSECVRMAREIQRHRALVKP